MMYYINRIVVFLGIFVLTITPSIALKVMVRGDPWCLTVYKATTPAELNNIPQNAPKIRCNIHTVASQMDIPLGYVAAGFNENPEITKYFIIHSLIPLSVDEFNKLSPLHLAAMYNCCMCYSKIKQRYRIRNKNQLSLQ